MQKKKKGFQPEPRDIMVVNKNSLHSVVEHGWIITSLTWMKASRKFLVLFLWTKYF